MTVGKRGTFITFEGQDGSGKSVQAAALAQHLSNLGHSLLTTREPGGTDLGAVIRSVLLDPAFTIDPKSEALLFAADRAQHISTKVRPALDRGETVIQDRYIDSSVAYQGAGRALSTTDIRELSMWAASDLVPDLTILIDLEPEVCRDRAIARSVSAGAVQILDRLEAENLDFRHRLRDGFLDIAANEPGRFMVVDGNQSLSEVTARITQEVDSWLATRN
jgi:dTMP kinase